MLMKNERIQEGVKEGVLRSDGDTGMARFVRGRGAFGLGLENVRNV